MALSHDLLLEMRWEAGRCRQPKGQEKVAERRRCEAEDETAASGCNASRNLVFHQELTAGHCDACCDGDVMNTVLQIARCVVDVDERKQQETKQKVRRRNRGMTRCAGLSHLRVSC